MRRSALGGRVRLSRRQKQRISLKTKIVIGGTSVMLVCAIALTCFHTFNFESAKATAALTSFGISSTSTKKSNGASSITWSHTSFSGTNQLLIVGVTTQDKPVSSVKYNNVDLTLAGSATRSGMRAYLYYMKNPPAGTYNIKVTNSSGTDVFAGAEVFDYVDLSSSFTTYTNSGFSASASSGNLTSSSAEYLFSVVGTIAKAPNAAGGSTAGHSIGGSHYNVSSYKTGSNPAFNHFTLSGGAESWAIVTLIIRPSVTLPVSWKSFEIHKNENSLVAKWITASEINNDYFILQSSEDGSNFDDLMKVSGSGNTTYDSEYSASIENRPIKDMYYRLKQVDFDGRYDYSEVLFVKADKRSEEVLVYPTVVSDHVTVQMREVNDRENFSCQIIDYNGKLIHDEVISGTELLNSHEFNTSELIKGNYLIVLQNSTGIVGKSKFVKN